jgi:5-methylcytosine-specific restriction endonuclease McrA
MIQDVYRCLSCGRLVLIPESLPDACVSHSIAKTDGRGNRHNHARRVCNTCARAFFRLELIVRVHGARFEYSLTD